MVNDAHINNTIAEYGTALTELLTRIGFAQADPQTGYTVTVRKGAETRVEIRDRVSFNADGFELWLSYGNNEVDRFAIISRSSHAVGGDRVAAAAARAAGSRAAHRSAEPFPHRCHHRKPNQSNGAAM